jgi:hypothetical protein
MKKILPKWQYKKFRSIGLQDLLDLIGDLFECVPAGGVCIYGISDTHSIGAQTDSSADPGTEKAATYTTNVCI